jgi:tripartite-type tricarboxylate transporter receptor subunit TctC
MSLRTNRRTAFALALSFFAPMSFAQANYPERPVTFVVPFSAGSATDQLARALATSFTEQTKQAVVVDNKPGAGGIIAAQAVARAAPDGYTVLVTTNTTQSANPHLYKKLPYDPVKDFKPLTALGRGGMVLVVRPGSPYKTVADLVAAAKSQPGKLSFGAGNSSSRVAGEMFKQLTGTDILFVPYKSNPNALTDLLGGQIDLMVIDTVTGMPQIEAGKLRPLGVSTPRRIPQLPAVPTIAEAGVKGYDIGYWYAAYVPAATPSTVASRLHNVLARAVSSPQAKAFFDSVSNEAWSTSAEELARFQMSETDKWGKVIRAADIQPE